MTKERRHLIVTADERTWKFDRPVVFLGEWCLLYDRKHIWQDMDAILAAPYGLGMIMKDADFSEARELEDRLFPLLCSALNQCHDTNHDARFWKILLGHWFRRYVEVMLNRVKTLEQCLSEHEISGFVAYVNNHYALATQDSYSSIWASNDDRWNNALTVRILDLLGVINIPIELISGHPLSGFSFKPLIIKSSFKKTVFKWGYQLIRKVARCLARDNDAVVINSYMPKKEEIKLQLALGQCPQLWDSSIFEISEKADRMLRLGLSKRLSSKSDSNLEDILKVMLFELLPVCYLEGFASLNKHVERQPWQKSPKFIFTSNNFDTDEVFKLWAATKVESGSKYFTGQHGNNFGTHRYMYPAVEEIIADKFLTWGWKDGLPQHTPTFLFKTVGVKAKQYNRQGGLLLIELHLNIRLNTWDSSAEFHSYFKEQQEFVKSLNNSAKQHLTVRLHSAHYYLKWNDELRWRAFDQKIKIDKGDVAISNLIANSRLVVHSYDSTGMLETLSQNIPTLAFWQNGLDSIRESAMPYYQVLVDAGIVHFTPESVAHKVNEVWDDVDAWWMQSNVQDARKEFCDRYAKASQTPIADLKEILN